MADGTYSEEMKEGEGAVGRSYGKCSCLYHWNVEI